MSQPELHSSLAGMDFFAGFSAEAIAHLAGNARTISISGGDVIFRQGDSATESYFVLEGLAALEICEPGSGCSRIATVAPGELLGWSPVLNRDWMFATARAINDLTSILIPGAEIRALCDADPTFGYVFMKRTAETLAARLSSARLQLLDVFSHGSTAPAASNVSTAGGNDGAR